jgi:hypothetical protein
MSAALDSFTRSRALAYERSPLRVRNKFPCPYISAAQDHFSLAIHVPGRLISATTPSSNATVTGDGFVYSRFGNPGPDGLSVGTVPLKPGLYRGDFSLNRRSENSLDPLGLDDPTSLDDVGVGVLLAPIFSNDDYNLFPQGNPSSPGNGAHPWDCFQNNNGDAFPGWPQDARSWSNGVFGQSLGWSTWPDSASYEWLSGLFDYYSDGSPVGSLGRYRCPFRLWISWGSNFGYTSEDDFDFTLTGQKVDL